MKICSKCKLEKPSEQFLVSSNSQESGGATTTNLCAPCRVAKRAYEREYYHKNPARQTRVKVRANAVKLSKKAQGKELIARTKRVPCADCHKSYPPHVMDLDHVHGVKHFTISHWTLGSMNLERLAEELAKCEVVCANCHRIRTYERQSVPDTGAAPVTQT